MPASVTRIHAEKRGPVVETTVRPVVKAALARLARMQNRKPADYVNHVLETHVFGLTLMLEGFGEDEKPETPGHSRTGGAYPRKGCA